MPRPTTQQSAAVPFEIVGGYRLVRVLGEGGMGVVYEAEGADGVAVALKILRASSGGEEARQRFERETAIRVEHPNVIRVIASGADATTGAHYLALELLVGSTLEDILRRGPLEPSEVLRMGLALASGLAEVHRAGFLHRDLKPANLFLCHDGNIKIMDFGIALSAAANRLTSAADVIGTPAYMSPEQVRGERILGPPSDVWSLGVVLYEAASRHSPFERETAMGTMLAVHLEDAKPLWAVAPGVPRQLASVIERAMSKRAELRFASMADLIEGLTAVDIGGASNATALHTSIAPPSGLAAGGVFGATEQHEAAPASILPFDERRIVAIVLFQGTRDPATLEEDVAAQGGILVPLIGDRAVGIFGAFKWEGDEVHRAALAAIAARGAAERVSIASGRAAGGGAGISGDVLIAAERGCSVLMMGVGVDEASKRALEAEFLLVAKDDGLYELSGRRGGGEEPAALREGPHLGRAGEVAQLRERLRTIVEDQRGAVVLLVGTPGIGKSRLVRALEQEIAGSEEPFQLLFARAEPLRRDRAFSVFARLLRARLPGSPNTDDVRELAAAAGLEAEAASRCAEFLAELLGIEGSSPLLLAARMDPRLMADRLRLALYDWVEAIARQGAVALLVEDAQWADSASLALLEDLAERLVESPFLIFVSARPELLEARPDLFAGRELLRLEPRGLGLSDVRALAEYIVGRALPPTLVKAIAERTGGHPLFVEQIVLELAGRGELDLEPESLPTTLTIEAAVQARVDQLPPFEKDACKRASVFGRAFVIDELEAMGVAAPGEVLPKLGKRDLIVSRARVVRGSSEREHQFKSSLLAEAVYALIAEGPARALHHRAAAYLALRGGDDEEIGKHHDRAGEEALAASRYVAAALAGSRRGDAQTVLRCSERALALGIADDAAFDVHMARADALGFLGRRAEQSEELEQARALAASDAELARVLTAWTVLLSRTGRPAEAFASGEAAVTAAERNGDADLTTTARVSLVAALIYGGKIDAARSLLEAARLGAGEASPHVRASLAGASANLATAVGDLAQRRAGFAAAGALYREAGDLRLGAAADLNLADVENRVGRFAQAEAALLAALEGSRRVKFRPTEGYALVNLGYAYIAQGKFAEAFTTLDQALALATSMNEVRLGFFARLYLARCRADSDPSVSASELLSIAREAETIGDRGIVIMSLAAAAAALLLGELPALAADPSRRALELLEEQGGIEEDEAEVYLTHADVLGARGLPVEASEVLRRGRARLDHVASQIADDEARRSFLSAVPGNARLVHRTRA